MHPDDPLLSATRRIKAWNRSVYYTLKYTLFGLLLGGLLLASWA